MISISKIFAFLIVLSIPLIACCSALLVSKSTSDDDIIKGTLQQVPRYYMFYHRAAPNFKRASSALDTLTGVTLGKRSMNPAFNRVGAPTSEMAADIYSSQQKTHPMKLSTLRLFGDNFPSLLDLAVPLDYNMVAVDQ